jgi:argininosuccinate synthase
MNSEHPILLAFSGGLDTSFCIPWLKETYDRPVITVNVDTGGLDDEARRDLETRAMALGALRHVTIDARSSFFERVLKYLVFGNVRRGNLYPLCVGAERVLQAQTLAMVAGELGAGTVAHGCTAAGNDQVRFEVAIRTLRPDLEVMAPVRDNAWQREGQTAFLVERGLPVPPGGGAYSINRGLWGVTIGGRETLDSKKSIPEEAWVLTRHALDQQREPARHTLGFERGVPVSIDDERLDPVELVERVERLAAGFGIGRGIHLGDTVLGTKGRVAFPGCRDIEARLTASQERVTGTVALLLRTGQVFVEGVTSEYSLLAATRGTYGEAAGEWTASDALGFSRMRALPGMLYTRAGNP